MDILIREVKESDAAEIVRLSSQLGYPTDRKRVLENIKELLQEPEYEVFVADISNDILAGFIHVYLTRRLFIKPFAELGGLIVDEQVRGKGIGTRLLSEAEVWANKRGCREVRVRSNILREGAKDFYCNQGYDEIKIQRVYLKEI